MYHFVKARADYEKDEEKRRSSIKRSRAEVEIQSENNAINNSQENEYADEEDDQQVQGSGHRSKYSQSEGTRKVEVDSVNGALTASSKLKNLYKSA